MAIIFDRICSVVNLVFCAKRFCVNVLTGLIAQKGFLMKKVIFTIVACVALGVCSAAVAGDKVAAGNVIVAKRIVARAPIARTAAPRVVYRAIPALPKVEVTAVPSEPIKAETGTKAFSRPSLLGRAIIIDEVPTLSVEGSNYELRRGLLGIPRWRVR